MTSVSMAEIAAKQRHLLLLKKVRNNQPLNAGELRELKAYEDMKPPKTKNEDDEKSELIATQKEAAAYCGVSARTMRSWEREYSLRDAAGNYIVERLDERIADREEDANPLKTRLMTADAEHKEVRAELGRIQLKIKMGELISREAIEAQRIERILETRRVLLSLIRKLPPLMKGQTFAQMTDTVRTEIYYALNVFSGKELSPESAMDELRRVWESMPASQKAKAKKVLLGRERKTKNQKQK